MKALSLTQPWAWLVIHGGKDIENRTWNTKFRGRFLVHAAKAMRLLDDYAPAVELAMSVASELVLPEPDELDRGGIIGSVELIDVVAPLSAEQKQLAMADWCNRGEAAHPWHFHDQYGFVLRNPEPLPFRPCKGALGFWRAE